MKITIEDLSKESAFKYEMSAFKYEMRVSNISEIDILWLAKILIEKSKTQVRAERWAEMLQQAIDKFLPNN